MNIFSYKNIIEPEDLSTLLQGHSESIQLIDSSFVLPGMMGDPFAIYQNKRIGNARFFDVDEIAASDTDLPHMLPEPKIFEKAVSALGIDNEKLVVVYHNSGIPYACARAWWMLRVFGHEHVCVLNGGLETWEQEGYPVNTQPPSSSPPSFPSSQNFKAHRSSELVKNIKDIYLALEMPQISILDARPSERFAGKVPEPRAGLHSGHMAGAQNLPFTDLIDPKSGKIKPQSALCELFAFMDLKENVIASCGSGLTACVLALGAHISGIENVSVYDGSWAEWGCIRRNNPVSIL